MQSKTKKERAIKKIEKNRVASRKQIFCCYFYNILSVLLSQHKFKKNSS